MNQHRMGLARVVLLTLILGVAIGAVGLIVIQQYRGRLGVSANWTADQFGLSRPVTHRLDPKFTDADGDLVADQPSDDACIDPETLVFSFIPTAETERSAETWRPLFEAITAATGKPVVYKSTETVDEQLRGLAEGEIHILGLNTGAVPRAVNQCGFVPVAAMGRDDGSYGTTLKMIVPADSPIESMEALRGKRITFTSTNSNSGFKAPLVILKKQFQMEPDKDYAYGFSTSHAESIRRICEGQLEVAAVASDMIDKVIADEGLDHGQYRVIYTSERFPPAALGMAYHLKDDLAQAIREALLKFEFSDEMREEFGQSGERRLVAISYVDDWKLIREIDDSLGDKNAAATDDDGLDRKPAPTFPSSPASESSE